MPHMTIGSFTCSEDLNKAFKDTIQNLLKKILTQWSIRFL
jgi:hypothetical protein